MNATTPDALSVIRNATAQAHAHAAAKTPTTLAATLPRLASYPRPCPPTAANTPEERAAREERRIEWEAEEAKRAAEEAARQRNDRRQRLWEASHVPCRYHAADLDNLGDDVTPKRLALASTLKDLTATPRMLALVGPRGTGKTDLACATVRHFCRCEKRARYTRAMDIFRAIRATYGGKRGEGSERDAVQELSRPDLLVIDEVQVRAETEWENNVLCDLLDGRYANVKATILIANLKPAELLESLGASITSRLQESGGIVIVDGESFRANGKARPATLPVVDHNSGTVMFTPVVPGAIPTEPGRTRYFR